MIPNAETKLRILRAKQHELEHFVRESAERGPSEPVLWLTADVALLADLLADVFDFLVSERRNEP
jgi:hypothetical protein